MPESPTPPSDTPAPKREDIGIIELLSAFGNENIPMQFLDRCVSDFRATRDGTKISFHTEQPFDFNGTRDLGIILWLPREEVARILDGTP